MSSIDLSRFQPKPRVINPTGKPKQQNLVAFFNRDLTFNKQELADKYKEYLYMELSSLLQAGMDIKSCFELIINDQEKNRIMQLFTDIQQSLLNGDTFSQALKQTSRFSLYEVFSLQIGEETGKLIEILQSLAMFFKNKIKQQRKIVSCLTYPAVVLATSLGAIFFMMKYIVPMFSDVFKRFGGELPWITAQIIRISQFIENNYGYFFILMIMVITVIQFTRKTLTFRKIFSIIILNIPIVGNLVKKIYLARFCNSMQLMINARLPLLKTLELIRQMIRFYPIESSISSIENDIMKGKSLHQCMRQFPVYPNKMIQLVKVGEETNQLDLFFGKISAQYMEEVEYKTSTLSNAMEPIIIIFLGLIVGVILISMYLPLFQMSNNF